MTLIISNTKNTEKSEILRYCLLFLFIFEEIFCMWHFLWKYIQAELHRNYHVTKRGRIKARRGNVKNCCPFLYLTFFFLHNKVPILLLRSTPKIAISLLRTSRWANNFTQCVVFSLKNSLVILFQQYCFYIKKINIDSFAKKVV